MCKKNFLVFPTSRSTIWLNWGPCIVAEDSCPTPVSSSAPYLPLKALLPNPRRFKTLSLKPFSGGDIDWPNDLSHHQGGIHLNIFICMICVAIQEIKEQKSMNRVNSNKIGFLPKRQRQIKAV